MQMNNIAAADIQRWADVAHSCTSLLSPDIVDLAHVFVDDVPSCEGNKLDARSIAGEALKASLLGAKSSIVSKGLTEPRAFVKNASQAKQLAKFLSHNARAAVCAVFEDLAAENQLKDIPDLGLKLVQIGEQSTLAPLAVKSGEATSQSSMPKKMKKRKAVNPSANVPHRKMKKV